MSHAQAAWCRGRISHPVEAAPQRGKRRASRLPTCFDVGHLMPSSYGLLVDGLEARWSVHGHKTGTGPRTDMTWTNGVGEK